VPATGAAAGGVDLAVAARRRSPLLAAAAVAVAAPWLRLRLRRQPTVRPKALRIATLPLQLAVEVAEMGYVLRARVRYRGERRRVSS
jgi:hypothetical protein